MRILIVYFVLLSKLFSADQRLPLVQWEGIIGIKHYSWRLVSSALAGVKDWVPDEGNNPSTSLVQSIEYAQNELKRHVGVNIKKWRISRIDLNRIPTTQKWIYKIEFSYAGELNGLTLPVTIGVIATGKAIPLEAAKK